LLPQPVLDAPRHGCLNIHASLLPRWRGAAPIHRAVIAGDRETGVCIMRMEAGLDTGPVLLRQATPIGPEDTTGDLHDRLSAMGARLIVAALDDLNSLTPAPQPDTGVTYAAKIDKAEARIDWSGDAETVARRINGLSPHPGAWADFGGERVKILRAKPSDRDLPAGRIASDDGLYIGAADGAVEILELQRPGRRPAPVSEVLRGWQPPDNVSS
jgi:methionyl-tRNA formyltransferase